MIYTGKLYTAGSTAHQHVELVLEDGHFTLHSVPERTLLGVFEKGTFRTDSRVGNLPRDIALSNGDLITVQADDNLHHWLDRRSDAKKQTRWSLSSLENSTRWAIASVVLAPLLLVAIFKFVIPAMAITFASYVPYTLKDVASRHTLSALDTTVLEPSRLDEDVRQRLTQRFATVYQAVQLDQPGFNTQFRYTDTMGANAFALPNGTIVFTDQLVELVEQDEKQLSAILLHEIGHVSEQHSMRLIAETIATTMVITYFFGDVSGVFETFMGASNTLINNQFSQKLETEADDFALRHASAAGLTPEDFADALEALASSLPPESEMDKILSSHPMLKDRIEKARAAQSSN